MPWTELTAETPPQLRPRPVDQPYAMTYEDGHLGFPPLTMDDLVRQIPNWPGLFYPIYRSGPEDRLGYDSDWLVALALEAKAKPSRVVGEVKRHPEQWLTVHPTLRQPAWRLAMAGSWTDKDLVRAWRCLPVATLQATLSGVPVLEEALDAHRPELADWLWEHGARPHPQTSRAFVARVLQMDPMKAWVHLGGATIGLQNLPKTEAPLDLGKNSPYTGITIQDFVSRLGEIWQVRLHGLGLPLDGAGYALRYREHAFNEKPERIFTRQHTAASWLLGVVDWTEVGWRVPQSTLVEAQMGWARWMEQQGLRWDQAGPRDEDGPRQDLLTFLETGLRVGNVEPWRAWLRERVLAHRPAPTTPSPGRRRA